jgi:GntR family transcriptional regulator / MocR family aminotransferase
MRRSSKPSPLARQCEVPLYRQIYQHFRRAIADGQLTPGDRLPSCRRLAEQFATARGTVDAAYAMLVGEGYVVSRGPAGTIVSPDLGAPSFVRAIVGRHPSAGPGTTDASAPKPFQMGLPALDQFPRKLWAHLVGRQIRRLSPAEMMYPDPAGSKHLRHAIAGYLATSRGINCSWHQVLVTHGYQGGLDLATKVLLEPRDQVWIEDPCYPPVRDALLSFGAALVPVRVDADGMRISEGRSRARRARLAVVTPSHQSPLGVALSLSRRLALLTWANEAKAYVLEDDYDSEFRFVGRPLPALKSLDHQERVVYAGTFSKVMFPGLRLGYLVVPTGLVATFVRASLERYCGHSMLEQGAVAAFITEGHFGRHLKRMRHLYAARRRATADALRETFGNQISLELQPGGMNLVARVSDRVPDRKLAKLAQEAGLSVEALSNRVIEHPCGQGLLIGFANNSEQDAAKMTKQLERAIGKHLEPFSACTEELRGAS